MARAARQTAGKVVEIKYDKRKLADIGRDLKYSSRALGAAVSRGINETVDKTKTFIKDKMHKELGIKKGAIGKGLKTQKASFRKWKGYVYVTGDRISLARFGVRTLASKNLSYKISNQQGKKIMQYDPDTNRVFVQKGKGGKQKHVWWIPSKNQALDRGMEKPTWIMLRGPSIPYAFDTNAAIVKATKRNMKENLFKAIRRNADAIMTGKAKISKRVGYLSDIT